MKKICYLTLLMFAMVFTACVKQYDPPIPDGTIAFGLNTAVFDSTTKPGTKLIRASWLIGSSVKTNQPVTITGIGTFNLVNMQVTNLHNFFFGDGQSYLSFPTEPKLTNVMPAFTLRSGEQKIIEMVFDLGTDTVGSGNPVLTIHASIGNIVIAVTPGPTVVGQKFTIKMPLPPPPPPAPLSIALPTFVSATSTTAGMVAVGTTNGAIDATKMSFNMILPTGSVSMKTVWKGKASNSGQPASFVKIGNVIAPVVGDSAVITSVVTASASTSTGTNFTAAVSYFPISQNCVSGTQYTMTLSSVTVTASTQSASVTPNLVFPTQTVVGSYPTFTINTAPITGFVPGATEYKFLELTVTANAMGDVSLAQLKFPITTMGFTSAGVIFANTRVTNVAGITINQSNGTVHNVTGTDYVLYTLPTDMLIKAGTSVTLYLMAPIAGTPTGASYAVYATIDAIGTLFMDVAGGKIVYPCTSPYGPLTTAKATLSN